MRIRMMAVAAVVAATWASPSVAQTSYYARQKLSGDAAPPAARPTTPYSCTLAAGTYIFRAYDAPQYRIGYIPDHIDNPAGLALAKAMCEADAGEHGYCGVAFLSSVGDCGAGAEKCSVVYGYSKDIQRVQYRSYPTNGMGVCTPN